MMPLTLENYIDRVHTTQEKLSKEIGKSRQRVWYWVKQGATVELTDIGIRIRMKSGQIVHESQVEK